MKGLKSKLIAWLCVIAMVGGLFMQAGPIRTAKAADEAAKETVNHAVREWYLYGDKATDTGLVVTDTTNGKNVTSGMIKDAAVDLPDGLTEANFSLQIKLDVAGDSTAITTLNNAPDLQFELANELYDCGELAWSYKNFVAGNDQVLTFAFKDAMHTNNTVVNGKVVSDGKTPFDWKSTINFFRFYQVATTTGLKITVKEIKIVYGDHGLVFGDTDTYLTLEDTMSATPNAFEATVNMPSSLGGKSWTIKKGAQFSTINKTVGSYTTVAGDAPGAGMECVVLDASSGAISDFEAQMNRLSIDAGAFAEDQLAVSFWVWSSSTGKLGDGVGHFRISSNLDNVSGNALYYSYNAIDVVQGWNYIELPLNKWQPDIKEQFTLSSINSFAFLDYDLVKDEIRYFGDFKLVALGKEDAEIGWTLHSATNSTLNGQKLPTGVTGENDAPGAGMTYSILDASSNTVAGFSTLDSVNIDISQYNKNELAVAFWVYTNKPGTLGTGDNFRISSGSALSSNFLHYQYNDKSLSTGWNYVVLPLSSWYDQYNFDWKTIRSFGFTSYGLASGNIRYFGDIKLIDLTATNEWKICTGASPNVSSGHSVVVEKNTVADGPGKGVDYFIVDASSSAINGFNTRVTTLQIDASKYSMEDVSLAFWVYANEDGTLGSGDHFRFSSDMTGINNNLIYYTYSKILVEQGWNYVELPLSDWSDEAKGNFSLNSINSFGFLNYSLPKGQIRKFADFKLVVSGKGANWTLCDTSTNYKNNYGLSYVAGSVSGNEAEPEVGTKYAQVEIPAYNASVAESGKFGFELPSMPALDVSSNPSDYAVGFWFYSSTGMMPSGQFELNSSKGANDAAELHWYPQNWGIKKGWNYVTINLGAYASDSTPAGVDFSNINYLRWYSDNGAQVTQDSVFAISDITLIKADTKEVVKTLCKAENQPLWYGRSKTVYTVKEGPSAGTSYVEATVPAYTGAQPVYKSCFGFFTSFNGINASAYEASNLTVSMWVYTATGKLPGGQIEINSSGTANDSAELAWFPSNFNSQLQIGWNKIELNLGKPHHTGGSGIDLSNINYIRWYTDENASVVPKADTTFRIGEIKLYADTVDEGNILITQNAKVTSDNYMIFSNANRTKEANPFALFVTGEGYPAVLCGTTQFTLTENICTGTDVTLKVARTKAGAIQFYINGKLKGTSKTVAKSLGAPSKAYNIGADGKGNQVFVGTIKDVKVYSNVAATKCIGNWPLIGDIKYVTEVMPDISDAGNDAHFAGSRANDWYDVAKANEDANEWSLVYIPEMCQRFYTNQHAIYHEAAKWIADDVNNVKHDNIKYVVADKTADGGQLNALNRGIEFFETSVPTSNLNDVKDNNHTYYRFQVGNGVKWMIMSLNVYAGESAYTWAKDIAKQYPSDNIIVVADVYTSNIYNTLGSRVKLIVSGGLAEGDEVRAGVPSMILPPHNDTEKTYFGGEQEMGLFYVLRFTNDGRKVTPRAYAPVYGKYFDDSVTRNIGSIAISLEKEAEQITEPVSSATGGQAPTTEKPGYKFAGWYQQYVQDLVGKTYAVYDAKESFQKFKTEKSDLSINAGDYELSNLAIRFWLYSNETGTFAGGKDSQLRLSSSKEGIGKEFVFWYLQNKEVNKGWNLIELSLGSASGNSGFNAGDIRRVGFTPFELEKGSYRYITDMELVVLDDSSKSWPLYSSQLTTTKTGQTLTTGVADGFALPVPQGTTRSDVYAKYVDRDVLGVKAQVTVDTYDKSNYTDIRFMTSVDSLNYKEVGFEIELTNPYTGKKAPRIHKSTYVYKKILAMTKEKEVEDYSAKQIFSTESEYFKTFKIKNVPNWAFSEEFTVQPYWITLDGVKVYGDPVNKSVWMGYPTEHLYLPKIVDTTYPTEDVVIATVVPTVEKYGYNIDSTGKVDCTEELQRALNDCHDMGGGTVYLPAGEYKIHGQITIPVGVTLRGDWQDPDKVQEGVKPAYGTKFIIDANAAAKTLSDQTSQAGVSKVNRNTDVVHNQTATFKMSGSSSVTGVTVYYTNQKLDSVKVVPYTFYIQADSVNNMLITLKDITVINGYRGIGTSYEKQHECLIVDNFKGTFLDCGLALYNASDVGRITGVSISDKYWKQYDGTNANAYMKTNTTGLEIGDLEWQQFSNCKIDGCKVGVSVVGGYRINYVGSMIDMSITNCTTGFTIAEKNDDTYYYSPTVENKDKYPLKGAMDERWGSVIARSTIQGSEYSIVNNTKPTYNDWGTRINNTSSLLRLTDVEYGNIKTNAYYDQNIISGASEQNIQSSSEDLSSYDARYTDTYEITSAKRKNLWVVDMDVLDGANKDVGTMLQKEIDDFASKYEGGIVYIPGGTYRLDNPIRVPAGIELRGASAVANREQYGESEGTLFMCYYGDDATNATSDQALITLAGDHAGVNGIKFLYPENVISYNENTNSTYAISAKNASNVYVVNTYIAASSYGVNFENCTDFWAESIYACCYLNTINAKSSKGVIRGCLSNPNMIARTDAKGLTANWPEEAKYDVTDAPINKIRNGLMQNLKFITLVDCSDILVQDITAYALNRLIDTKNSSVLAINANADLMLGVTSGEPGYQFYVSGGSLTAINALRTSTTLNAESITEAHLYNKSNYTGAIKVYNSLTASGEGDDEKSAFEANTNVSK